MGRVGWILGLVLIASSAQAATLTIREEGVGATQAMIYAECSGSTRGMNSLKRHFVAAGFDPVVHAGRVRTADDLRPPPLDREATLNCVSRFLEPNPQVMRPIRTRGLRTFWTAIDGPDPTGGSS